MGAGRSADTGTAGGEGRAEGGFFSTSQAVESEHTNKDMRHCSGELTSNLFNNFPN